MDLIGRFASVPEMVDGHVRFAMDLDGRRRNIFVRTQLIEDHALRRHMGRSEVIAYVSSNEGLFLRSAARKIRAGQSTSVIMIEEADDLH